MSSLQKDLYNNFHLTWRLLEFLGDDKEKIGKINTENMNILKEDITMTDMKQGIGSLRLKSSGSPDY